MRSHVRKVAIAQSVSDNIDALLHDVAGILYWEIVSTNSLKEDSENLSTIGVQLARQPIYEPEDFRRGNEVEECELTQIVG